MHTRLLYLSVAAILIMTGRSDAQEQLDPANTYAVITGVLQWPNKALAPFSDVNRKDQELYDTLRKRGVPAENMALLLDKQATHAGICKALDQVAATARRDATLLFYFAGHGSLGKTGKICLCDYDFTAEKGLDVQEIGSILARAFKGKRVFLMADCCYSGGLKHTAEVLKKAGVGAVALTSASASNTSTLNWTFTQTVLDALNGEPMLDTDGDGIITLKELADETFRAMKFREKQFYGYANFGVPASFRLGKVAADKKRPDLGKDEFSAGEYVVAQDKMQPRTGRIIGKRENNYVVEFYDYSVQRLTMLPAADLQKIRFWSFPAGKETLAFWGNKTWKAKILKTEGDFHLITYPGWESYWDEWVLCDRLVDPALAATGKVEVEWKGKYYPAQILKIENGQHYVRYFNYDSNWNEWVAKSRIKWPQGK